MILWNMKHIFTYLHQQPIFQDWNVTESWQQAYCKTLESSSAHTNYMYTILQLTEKWDDNKLEHMTKILKQGLQFWTQHAYLFW
jgi:hypothetical protein